MVTKKVYGNQSAYNHCLHICLRYHYTNIDPSTGAQVYANFNPPSGTSLHASNLTKLVYRCRPRYNSEYLYNIPALTSIGAYPPGNDYHTKECWFSLP